MLRRQAAQTRRSLTSSTDIEEEGEIPINQFDETEEFELAAKPVSKLEKQPTVGSTGSVGSRIQSVMSKMNSLKNTPLMGRRSRLPSNRSCGSTDSGSSSGKISFFKV
jgi:hypothetical protein